MVGNGEFDELSHNAVGGGDVRRGRSKAEEKDAYSATMLCSFAGGQNERVKEDMWVRMYDGHSRLEIAHGGESGIEE